MTVSRIEWTDRSDWNPLRGCTRVSEGCRNCYAEGIAARFSGPGRPFHGFAENTAKGPRWTGKVQLLEHRLTLPLRWEKPARIFVSSTSDIFHESLPDQAIDRIFAVMALAPQHTFQLLTKRATRMREYVTQLTDANQQWERLGDAAAAIVGNRGYVSAGERQWPLRNVWLGVSVEDQDTAEERIHHLLATPAAVRFVSAEPLLGPIDLFSAGMKVNGKLDRQTGDRRFLDWVIAGGESGRNARPMHPDWARSLRDQCQAAGVPFFFKQWGEWAPSRSFIMPEPIDVTHWIDRWGRLYAFDDPRAEGSGIARIGKKDAGRTIDGREWSEFPA